VGSSACLALLERHGFKLSCSAWMKAARLGHVNCLAFALAHGHELDDIVMKVAVGNGHMACVDLLIRHGLPHEPYMHYIYPVPREQMACIEHMAHVGVDIHPDSLTMAARYGDVDYVRWAYTQGVPLWHTAQV
jgi:hypothetical protein